MIVWTESYFMNPTLDGALDGLGSLASLGLASLGCGASCKCDNCSHSNLGSILDRGANTMWMCDTFPGLTWTEMCRVPTKEEITADTSFYGKNLSLASQRQIEDKVVELAPNYEVDTPRSYIKKQLGIPDLDLSGINWLVIGGVIFGGVLLLKKL